MLELCRDDGDLGSCVECKNVNEGGLEGPLSICVDGYVVQGCILAHVI